MSVATLQIPDVGFDSRVPEDQPWKLVLNRVKRAMGLAQYIQVDPNRIRPMPGQPREYFDETGLEELTHSIVEVGQFMPGIIRPVVSSGDKDYELLDGERRWRSVLRGRVSIYKAMLVEIDDEAAPFVIASIANFNRAGHTHIEISDAIDRLHNGLGMPIPAIAEMYNIDPNWAYQLHSLRKLNPSIRTLLDPRLKNREQLPVTVAIQVAKLEPEVQQQLVTAYRSGSITIKGLRKEAIEIAERSGTYIRQREADQPARTLRKLQIQSNALLRAADDFKLTLGEQAAANTLKHNSRTAADIRGVLDAARSRITEAYDEMQRLAESLRMPRAAEIHDAPPPAESLPRLVAAHTEQRRPVTKPPEITTKPVVAPKPVVATSSTVRRPPAPTVEVPAHVPSVHNPDWQTKREITALFYDPDAGRDNLSPVTLRKYLAIWDENRFDFQRKGKPKPDSMPTREEVAAFLARASAISR